VRGRIELGGPRAVIPGGSEPGGQGASACGFGNCTGLYVAVRRIGGADGPARVQVSGQRRGRGRHEGLFSQVRGHVEVQAGAVCKTVGSAYVGSNPTPATTCENGPLAVNSRLGGPFPSCHALYHGVSP